ncbi:hypothetical protein PAMP_019486 [Pampus punctatissimus]
MLHSFPWRPKKSRVLPKSRMKKHFGKKNQRYQQGIQEKEKQLQQQRQKMKALKRKLEKTKREISDQMLHSEGKMAALKQAADVIRDFQALDDLPAFPNERLDTLVI